MHHSTVRHEHLLARLVEHVPERRRFRVHQAVALQVPPSWGWSEPRLIDDYHLLLVQAGVGGYVVGDRRLGFDPGMAILLGSGVRHSAWQDHADPPRIIALRFGCYDLARRQPPPGRILAHSGQVLVLPPGPGSLRMAMAERLVQVHNAGRDGEASSVLHALLALLADEATEQIETVANDLDPRIERVRQQLDLHPVRRLVIDDMAAMAGLSRNYFVRLFTRQVGRAPKAYQIAARMRFARYLLEHTDASIQQVARDLRYPDAFAFSKQFRAVHGRPPSTCRG